MPLVTTRELVDNAATRRIAVGAFNVITLEHVEAVIEGAERANAAVILQISENAVRFHNGRLAPIAAASAAVAEAASVPRRCTSTTSRTTTCCTRRAPPGSARSCTTRQSSTTTRTSRPPGRRGSGPTPTACTSRRSWARSEARTGRTPPGSAPTRERRPAFVAATGVDALAVAVGSSHAMTDRTAALDHALIADLADAVPVPLVLHGSSGVPDAELAKAVRAGITKINIGTILNVEFTAAVRATLRDDERLVDPRKYLRPARTGVAAAVAHLLSVLSRQP